MGKKCLISLLFFSSVLIFQNACTSPAVPSETTGGQTPSPSQPSATRTPHPEWDWIASLAVQDLALRLSAPVIEISVVEIIPVDWEERSLGCPLPGKEYPPVLVPGLLLRLLHLEVAYEYHADLSGRLVLCSPLHEPLLPVIPLTPGDIQDGSPWMPVDPAP